MAIDILGNSQGWLVCCWSKGQHNAALNIASSWASTGTNYTTGDPLSGILEFNNYLYAIDYDGNQIRSANGDTWTNNIGGALSSPMGP